MSNNIVVPECKGFRISVLDFEKLLLVLLFFVFGFDALLKYLFYYTPLGVAGYFGFRFFLSLFIVFYFLFRYRGPLGSTCFILIIFLYGLAIGVLNGGALGSALATIYILTPFLVGVVVSNSSSLRLLLCSGFFWVILLVVTSVGVFLDVFSVLDFMLGLEDEAGGGASVVKRQMSFLEDVRYGGFSTSIWNSAALLAFAIFFSVKLSGSITMNFFLFLLGFGALIFTGAKAAMIGCFLSLLAYLVKMRLVAKGIAVFLIVMGFMLPVISVLGGYVQVEGYVQDQYYLASLVERLAGYSKLVDFLCLIEASCYSGLGFGNFGGAFMRSLDSSTAIEDIALQRAMMGDNLYIYGLMSLGFVGVSLSVWGAKRLYVAVSGGAYWVLIILMSAITSNVVEFPVLSFMAGVAIFLNKKTSSV